ncbi:MAG: ATP-dependent Clp protease proteolytic subunit [Thermoanaerobacteraceae bacterium]|nr:ATP-dependent Clp protease proteolytic subunit [Thermoanaerobacteraceae bacterium]
MYFWDLIWLLLFIYTLIPVFKQRDVVRRRINLIRELEKKRGSRVIVMIHRQESISFLGIPLSRYINIEDSEQVLRAIRLTPDDMPIDIILHTPGGLVLASEQIARAISMHKGKVTVIVPHYAMSGGTLIALASDEIIMDENAVLGPVDPQIGNYPAASILKVLELKDKRDIDDETMILADMAYKARAQVMDCVYEILRANNMEETKAYEIAKILTEGRWTHDYPITCKDLKNMELNVNHNMPLEVYQLMELYPQPAQRRPSVEYVPLPYDSKNIKNDKRN